MSLYWPYYSSYSPYWRSAYWDSYYYRGYSGYYGSYYSPYWRSSYYSPYWRSSYVAPAVTTTSYVVDEPVVYTPTRTVTTTRTYGGYYSSYYPRSYWYDYPSYSYYDRYAYYSPSYSYRTYYIWAAKVVKDGCFWSGNCVRRPFDIFASPKLNRFRSCKKSLVDALSNMRSKLEDK